MRYQLPPRRISMKHLFPSTALAFFIGLGFASMSTNTFAANSAITTASRRWTTLAR